MPGGEFLRKADIDELDFTFFEQIHQLLAVYFHLLAFLVAEVREIFVQLLGVGVCRREEDQGQACGQQGGVFMGTLLCSAQGDRVGLCIECMHTSG